MNHDVQPLHRSRGRARAPRRLLVLAATALCLLSTGCTYRITIQQGNYLDEELISQVETNMTRAQVQFLLGTPMISDPFHADRWDYLYYVITGRRRRVEQGHFVVYFQDDRVASVERIAN